MWLLVFLLTTAICGNDKIVDTGVVDWVWKGAVTHDSLVLKVGMQPNLHPEDSRLQDLFARVEILDNNVAPSQNFASSRKESFSNLLTFNIRELPLPNTAYKLSLIAYNVVLYESVFKTLPTHGKPADIKIAFSSCMDDSDTTSNIFKTIETLDPSLFIHLGDLHYENLVVNDTTIYEGAYRKALTSYLGTEMLNMKLPTIYMFDDHDFGPDNSDRESPGRDAAVSTYGKVVPHYPSKQGTVYQSFAIATTLFLLTDLRSSRVPNSAPDDINKSVLGSEQKEWFKQMLLEGSRTYDTIVWCNTMPWIDEERKWGHFKTETAELVEFIKQNSIQERVQLIIISGDAHMLAIDDGTNSPGNIPVFHAAAIGRKGSIKGGPYSHGAFPGTNQFGLLSITKDNCISFTAYREDTVLQSLNLCTNETLKENMKYIPPPIIIRKIKRFGKKWVRRLEAKEPVPVLLTIAFVVLVKVSIGALIFYCSLDTKSKLKES